MKTSALWLSLLLLALFLANGCSRSGKTSPGLPPVPVSVVTAQTQTVPVSVTAVGNVAPISKVTVRSQITGALMAVNFKEGQPVKQGDLLFTLDPRPAQATLARDRAQLENAEVQYAREQKLLADKVASQDEYDTSKAARDTLAATVQTDELNLEYCSIRSPVDGVAGSQQVFAGNIVKSPDDVLLTINQIQPIYVAFAVPEQSLPEIKAGMREKTLAVTATYTGMTGPAATGELTFVDNTVDPTTGTIQLKGTFPNTDAALWPGQFVNVSLTVAEIPNAVVVPSEAIQTGQNGQFIYVVKADQTVEMRPVTPGEILQDETVVTSGLSAGETVVTDGQLRLTPGAKVSVKTK